MIEENRIGRFELMHDEVRRADDKTLLALMSNFFIVRAEYFFFDTHIEYIAYSPLFGVVDRGEKVPLYQVTIDNGGQVRVFKKD